MEAAEREVEAARRRVVDAERRLAAAEGRPPPAADDGDRRRRGRRAAAGARLCRAALVATYAALFVWQALCLPQQRGRVAAAPFAADVPPFTVDVLSVASVARLPLLRAQRRTFASHASVRNFFNATEADDADPGCHAGITVEQVSLARRAEEPGRRRSLSNDAERSRAPSPRSRSSRSRSSAAK